MSTLLNPVNRPRDGIKWLLVAHTVAIFLFVTVFTIINLDLLSISYINKRESQSFMVPPGPLGYQYLSYSTATGIVSTIMFLLNNLLVDGLLVRFVFNPLTQMFNVGCSSSYIDVTLCTP